MVGGKIDSTSTLYCDGCACFAAINTAMVEAGMFCDRTVALCLHGCGCANDERYALVVRC